MEIKKEPQEICKKLKKKHKTIEEKWRIPLGASSIQWKYVAKDSVSLRKCQ